ncbi:hypothetical protein MMC07_006574 [Pseudocyphellaria aurata]|nr:hypothetical protein [Pseudocyphellaria aurata]
MHRWERPCYCSIQASGRQHKLGVRLLNSQVRLNEQLEPYAVNRKGKHKELAAAEALTALAAAGFALWPPKEEQEEQGLVLHLEASASEPVAATAQT